MSWTIKKRLEQMQQAASDARVTDAVAPKDPPRLQPGAKVISVTQKGGDDDARKSANGS